MGTPEFAVPSLQALVASKFNVVAVVTAPDKPQGRGQKLVASPVKECALKLNIPVLQPVNLKATEFIDQLKTYNANLQVVVAFRMLPEVVWSMPSFGTFNLHASLLPQYRGAAPINWAIINGEKETGVTTFFLKHEIDTGGIIFQEVEPINPDDTAGTLYERLMNRGARLVVRTAKAVESGTATGKPQGAEQNLKHAPKIFKETCEVKWNQPTETVRNFVRGLAPYPAAWTVLDGQTFKIYKVSATNSSKNAAIGEYATDNRTYVYVKASDGWLSIDELQPEGKKRMSVADFLRGNNLGEGNRKS
nr:methionyl-tRNA formyltransferase [uncultured bacterium]